MIKLDDRGFENPLKVKRENIYEGIIEGYENARQNEEEDDD